MVVLRVLREGGLSVARVVARSLGGSLLSHSKGGSA